MIIYLFNWEHFGRKISITLDCHKNANYSKRSGAKTLAKSDLDGNLAIALRKWLWGIYQTHTVMAN